MFLCYFFLFFFFKSLSMKTSGDLQVNFKRHLSKRTDLTHTITCANICFANDTLGRAGLKSNRLDASQPVIDMKTPGHTIVLHFCLYSNTLVQTCPMSPWEVMIEYIIAHI